jgi:hypothetical protein
MEGIYDIEIEWSRDLCRQSIAWKACLRTEWRDSPAAFEDASTYGRGTATGLGATDRVAPYSA